MKKQRAKPFLICFVFAVMSAGTGNAQPTISETKPIGEIHHLSDFQIQGCEGTRAFGSMHYYASGADQIALTDLCLDESSGNLLAAQPAKDLVLVEKDGNNAAFEVLQSGPDRYRRVRLEFVDEVYEQCPTDVTGTTQLYYNVPPNYRTSHQEFVTAYLEGYKIGKTSSTPSLPLANGVALFFRPLSMNGKGVHTTVNMGAIGALSAFKFDGETGLLTLNKGDGYSSTEPSGSLSISRLYNDELMIKGNFTLKNRRLAGHHPKEWISVAGNLEYMRGHFLGPDGEYFKGLGFASGTFVDASGNQHSFTADAMLYKCFNDKSE